jgi:hypothetical protein
VRRTDILFIFVVVSPPSKMPQSQNLLPSASIPRAISAVFEQAQHATTGYDVSWKALHTLHQRACVSNSTGKLFVDHCLKMVSLALAARKNDAKVNRVLRFVAGYLRFIIDEGNAFFLLRDGSVMILCLYS